MGNDEHINVQSRKFMWSDEGGGWIIKFKWFLSVVLTNVFLIITNENIFVNFEKQRLQIVVYSPVVRMETVVKVNNREGY